MSIANPIRRLEADRSVVPFLIASTILHASLFVTWQPVLNPIGQLESVLSVQLAALAPVDTAPASPQGNAPSRLKSSSSIPARAQSESPSIENRTVAPSDAPAGAVSPPPSGLKVPASTATPTAVSDTRVSKQALTLIRGRIMSDLARHFAYPEIARQHGWQGKVLLGFEVLADGRLDRIHVARSSGYYVLDQSAVNSIAQIERVFGANRWLHGYPVDMQIPVIYRLMEP